MLVFETEYLMITLKAGVISGIISLTVRPDMFLYSSLEELEELFQLIYLSRIFSIYIKWLLQEGIAVGRTFSMFKNYHIDGNKEMMAIGMMNIVGSCTSCYITTGIFPPYSLGA
jgi:MFS superfamily sulfate permease-like transporter